MLPSSRPRLYLLNAYLGCVRCRKYDEQRHCRQVGSQLSFLLQDIEVLVAPAYSYLYRGDAALLRGVYREPPHSRWAHELFNDLAYE